MFPALAWLVIPQDFVIHLGDLQLKSWRLFILLVAIPSGLTALSLRLFLPESPKYLMANGKEEEALRILQTIYSTNTRLPKDLYPVSMSKSALIKHILRTLNENAHNAENLMKGVELIKLFWINYEYYIFNKLID